MKIGLGKIYDCECIKENNFTTRDGSYVNITHKVGDKTRCQEMLDQETGKVIGHYIEYDKFRYRVFDFNKYYKLDCSNI